MCEEVGTTDCKQPAEGSDDHLGKRKRDLHIKGKGGEREQDGGQQPRNLDISSDVEDLLILPKTPRRRQSDTLKRTSVDSPAQSFHLDFAQAILTSLPRELRDQIYTQVLGTGHGKITVCDGKLPHHLRSNCDRMRTHDTFWDTAALRHYVDPVYVGTQMADEIARTFYKANTFYFDYHELYLLEKFLGVDRFGRGYRPAELVQRIEIVLDEYYRCSCNANALAFCGRPAKVEASPADVIQLCLEHLFLTTSAIHIKFIIFYTKERKQDLEPRQSLIEILSPIILRLHAQGRRVSLALHTSTGCVRSVECSGAKRIEEEFYDFLNNISQ
ncbi:hypothetical protein CC80DRAFT_179820 [Byssothecium circinans]|uniref:Uncharacterized protein n=1 Tax=Byssothecium circinans TaxID=147558 RepID=A0A6A5TTZ8_9PLEO|nr:hypothetical protein CC80DRAFT_179820 [Byssothecium circinans]